MSGQGKCWYCAKWIKGGEEGTLFSMEFDTPMHEECLKQNIKGEETDRETAIIAREFNML